MLTTLAILVQLAIAAALALGLARPGSMRARCGNILVAGAGAFVGLALLLLVLDPGTRTLALTHSFSGMVDQVTTGVVAYPIGERSAPGWLWPLPIAAFLLLHGLYLRLRSHATIEPFWPLLLWAWTALGTHFALELAAAPLPTVRPLPFERWLYPVALAAAFLIARRQIRVAPTLFQLLVLVELCRLPLAIVGTLATEYAWNIGLDVHATTSFVNPLSQLEVDVPAGSREQMAWLIWAPHAILIPAFYFLSTGGIAICVCMFEQHGEGAREDAKARQEATRRQAEAG